MNDLVNYSEETFESIKHVNEYGQEYWLARELQPILDYAQWRRFAEAIDRAKLACQNSGFDVSDHFADVGKMVDIGSGAEREISATHPVVRIKGEEMRDEIRKRIEAVRRGEVPEGYQQVDGYVIPEAWHLEAFSKKFKRSVRRNTAACNNVLTISAQLGLVSQKEYYDKDIASEDKSGYFLLQRGEFAYNKSYSSGYPYGAIKRLEKYEEGIVSPLYICFEPNRKTNADFYAHYFEAGLYNREIYRFAQEGARNHGLLNISTEDFFEGALIVPPEEEQQKIADILATCDRVIELKQKRVEELKQLKKTCLAKMFPQDGENVPELRFPGFTVPWEQRKLGDLSDIRTGPFGSTLHAEDYVEDGVPIITTEHFKTGTLQRVKMGLPQVSNDDYYRLSAYVLIRGDIVFSRVGSVDVNALITPFQEGWLFSGRVLRVRPFNDYSSSFLHVALDTDTVKNDIRSRAVGQTMPSINTEILKVTGLRVPISLEEQEQIGEFLTRIDNLITLHQREVEAEQQKNKALMQLLLTGLVRVPD